MSVGVSSLEKKSDSEDVEKDEMCVQNSTDHYV